MYSLWEALGLPVWFLLTSMATNFFSPRLKQYFVALTDCLVSLVSRAQLLLATVSVCLACSHISISVHLKSLSIASHLASFASSGLSWSYLGLSSCFTAGKWHSCQSGILQCIPTNLSSLADWKNSILQSWMLLQWSSPINSVAEYGLV